MDFKSNIKVEHDVLLPLSASGNLTQNWQEWKKNFIKYLEANEYTKLSENIKIHLLKEKIGPFGIFFINRINEQYHENEWNTLPRLFAKLDIEYKVPITEIEARYNFFTCSREENEAINKYVRRLKKIAIDCNFKDMMDDLIRDKVITSINDEYLLLLLFKNEYANLSTVVHICSSYESKHNIADDLCSLQIQPKISTEGLEKVKNTKKKDKTEKVNKAEKTKKVEKAKKVEKIEKVEKVKAAEEKRNVNFERVNICDKTNDSDKDQTKCKEFKRYCWKCNQRHQIHNCPAFGHKCEVCGDRNHFTNCCQMNTPRDANTKTFSTYSKKPAGASQCCLHTPSNTTPSAPPAFKVDNIYPNINSFRDSEKYM